MNVVEYFIDTPSIKLQPSTRTLTGKLYIDKKADNADVVELSAYCAR